MEQAGHPAKRDAVRTGPDHPNTRNLLMLLFTGVLMGALDISIVGPAIPEMSRTISVPADELSWVYTIYILFNLVGLPFLARLADVLGRRLVYILSISLFGAGSLIVGLSDEIVVLLVGRAIQGLGSGGVFPVAAAVIGDVFPPEKRGRALGMLGAVFGLAFLLGPILAGFMLRYLEWNSLFMINLPIAVLLIVFSFRLLSGRRSGSLRHFDWPGILLLGGFAAFFGLALNHSQPGQFLPSLAQSPVSVYLLISLLCLASLILVERRAVHPVVNLKLFRRAQVRIAGLMGFGTGMLQSCVVYVPAFLVAAFGISSSDASFMLIPVVLSTAVGSPVSGRLLDRAGSRVIVAAGMLLAGSGFFVMSFIRASVAPFYLAAVLIGFGISMLAGPSLRYIILNEVEASERTLSQGILTMFFSLGQITGSAVIGAVIATYSNGILGYTFTFYMLSLVSAGMFLFALRLKGRKKEIEAFGSPG